MLFEIGAGAEADNNTNIATGLQMFKKKMQGENICEKCHGINL
jgi:hypothetical protein